MNTEIELSNHCSFFTLNSHANKYYTFDLTLTGYHLRNHLSVAFVFSNTTNL